MVVDYDTPVMATTLVCVHAFALTHEVYMSYLGTPVGACCHVSFLPLTGFVATAGLAQGHVEDWRADTEHVIVAIFLPN